LNYSISGRAIADCNPAEIVIAIASEGTTANLNLMDENPQVICFWGNRFAVKILYLLSFIYFNFKSVELRPKNVVFVNIGGD